MDPIEVKEHGLIEHITLPVRPGVNIFRGPNDCGKYIAELVDPHIKDPVAADTKRIQAWLTLNGAEPDPAKFHELFPGGKEDFELAVGPVEVAGLVELAGIVKRRLEARSRDNASRAADLNMEAEVCKLACEGVDISVETDTAKLQTAFEEAVKREAEVRERARSIARFHEAASRAATSLAVARAGYQGSTVQVAHEALNEVQTNLVKCYAAVKKAESALDVEKGNLFDAQHSAALADNVWEAAKDHEAITTRWQATINETTDCKQPTSTELATTERAVIAAREAIELGAKARDAEKKTQQTLDHLYTAHLHAGMAESFRQAALATDDVLSDAVDSDALTVVCGRLMTSTKDRGMIPYGDRSYGDRVNIAMREAMKIIKRGWRGHLHSRERFQKLNTRR